MSGTGYSWGQVAPVIIGLESGGNPTAQNPTSSASGLFQDINSTWAYALGLIGGSAAQYPTAKSAPSDVQYAANEALFNAQGLQPWAGDVPQINATLGGNATVAGAGAASGGSGSATPQSWLGAIGGAAANLAGRAGVFVLAIILLIGGVVLFALRTQAQSAQPG